MALERVDHPDWLLKLGGNIIRARSEFVKVTGKYPNIIYLRWGLQSSLFMSGNPKIDNIYGLGVRTMSQYDDPDGEDFRLALGIL